MQVEKRQLMADLFFIGIIVTCIVIFCCSAVHAQTPDAYNRAHEQAGDDGKPLIVALGATWCGPCREVEATCKVAFQERGHYVHLDIDRYPEFVKQFPRDPKAPGMIPEVIVYERRWDSQRRVYVWCRPQIYTGVPEIRVWLGR